MSASIDSFANSAKPFVDSMDLVRHAPNCSVCVDKHLASQHCATCDDVMCEEAVSVHRELVKCWAADQHVMVRVRDMDPNMSATAKAVIAVRTKIDARLTKLQNFRRELLGREARAGQKLWTVSFYSHPLTPPFFFQIAKITPLSGRRRLRVQTVCGRVRGSSQASRISPQSTDIPSRRRFGLATNAVQ